jgi:uncharacterized membrane protein YgcG
MHDVRKWVVGLVGLGLGTAIGVGACSGGSGDDGTAPTGRCAPTDPSCPALGVECLALYDYSGQPSFTLRMAQLSITRPAVLMTDVLYSIIGDGVNVNLPTCNVSGKGTFCWLMQFDTERGTLLTGGAKPKADPTAGYCFERDQANSIAPIEVAAPIAADGSFTAAPIDFLSIPIYLDMTATGLVRLPLHDVRIGGTVSADQNCIGGFNADGLEPVNNCKPDLGLGIEYFLNGATLEGYILLEDADQVVVEVINQSLCVLLSGDPATYGDGGDPMRCRRDAGDRIVLTGDWCSTSNSAGGCQDSMRLTAGIAASAVALSDGCSQGGAGGSGGAGGAGGSAGGSGGAGGAAGGAAGAGGV